MRIVHLSIKNFRGIRSLDWSPPPGVTCLVGRGDSGKTTILDAIELALLPRNRVQFANADFNQGETAQPIEIQVTTVEVPPRLYADDKFGLEVRGWTDGGEVRDEPRDEDTWALTVRLRVDDTLEPDWRVVNDRNPEGRRIGPTDRAAIGAVRLGDATGRQLSWVQGSSLTRVSDSPQEIGEALSEAHRGAWDAVEDLSFEGLSATAERAGEWGMRYGSYANLPLGVGLEPRSLNIGAGSLTLRQDNGVSASALGTGSRRLLGLAIQRQAVGTSVVALVDEVEAGLEPHRLRHVIRQLSKSDHQALLVSHSPIAVAELGSRGLGIVRGGTNGEVEVIKPADGLQGVVRAMPEAILGRKVVVCEGKTEAGMALALVRHWDSQEASSLATTGTVIVPGEGHSAPQRAADLRSLGFDCIYWGDSDVPISPSLQELESMGVKTVVWGEETNTEQRLMADATEPLLKELWGIAVDEKGSQSVCDQLYSTISATGSRPQDWEEWRSRYSLDSLRSALGQAASDGEWYKRITAGELVGEGVVKALPQLAGTNVAETLEKLRNLAYRD